MDGLFIKAWFLFVAFLVAIAMLGIRLTAPKEETSIPISQLNPGDAPKNNPMITVPAGEFMMGSEEGGANEKPPHPVYLDTYRINQFEVMQAHYAEFVKAARHRSPLSRYVKNITHFNHPNQPAVYVSWEDAEAYCQWRGERLPTEAEWEKAARGIHGISWPWTGEYQVGFANFLGAADHAPYSAIVGTFHLDKSPFGLYDVSGNVREWVQDWYEEDYYPHSPRETPKGPATGTEKALRGSSWNDSRLSGRLSSRIKMVPDYRDITIGFRCAQSGEAGEAIS